MSGVIPKPNMRALHATQGKRQLFTTFAIAAVVALIFKTTYMDPRRKRTEEFYKTYDNEAALKKMNASGLMQSCPLE